MSILNKSNIEGWNKKINHIKTIIESQKDASPPKLTRQIHKQGHEIEISLYKKNKDNYEAYFF